MGTVGERMAQRYRRQQREQAESNWRVKEGDREQTTAARALWGAVSAGAGRREYAKSKLEQRRHWQRTSF